MSTFLHIVLLLLFSTLLIVPLCSSSTNTSTTTTIANEALDNNSAQPNLIHDNIREEEVIIASRYLLQSKPKVTTNNNNTKEHSPNVTTNTTKEHTPWIHAIMSIVALGVLLPWIGLIEMYKPVLDIPNNTTYHIQEKLHLLVLGVGLVGAAMILVEKKPITITTIKGNHQVLGILVCVMSILQSFSVLLLHDNRTCKENRICYYVLKYVSILIVTVALLLLSHHSNMWIIDYSMFLGLFAVLSLFGLYLNWKSNTQPNN